MPKVIKEPVPFETDSFYLYCPGCYRAYQERYPDKSEDFWVNNSVHCFSLQVHSYNDNAEAPTLSPSLLWRHTWQQDGTPYCCHSFVRDGKIQFLMDCSHPLRGQTVDLMDVPHFHLEPEG